MSLGLGELFDLEGLVLKEKEESEEVRRSRYRTLGRRALDQGTPAEDAAALLRTLVPQGRTPTPGSRFETAVAWFHSLVAFAGLLCGAVVALGLFHSGGPHPVNVLNVLAALVGVQILLLLLLLVALIPRNRAPSPTLVHEVLLRGLQRLMRILMPESDPETIRNLVARLDAHMGLTRWLLVRAAQIFGVSFNLAALAGCLYRIVFTDVAFGWSTTLHVDAAEFRRILNAVASPWSWLLPKAVPTQEMVQMTQYSHLEGKYLLRAAGERSLSPAILGGWWRFLILSVVTYGFLPRMIVLTLSELRVRTVLRETPIRNEEFRRLVDWMKLPLLTTSAEGSAAAPATPTASPSGPDPALPPPGSSCEVVVDDALNRDAVDRVVRERFGWSAAPPGSPDAPLVIVLSAWEEPTKGNQRHFQGLSAERLIVLGLFNPSPNGGDDPRLGRIRDRWKRQLQGLRCRVEALG
jgi:uncharacterized protein DUF2868